jgi:uncharacterized protein GlcG (DUF336 family)
VKLTLEQASFIVDKALKKAREMNLKPICVVMLDDGGHLKALRELGERLKDRPAFLGALSDMSGGKVVPVAGGVLVRQGGVIVGAVGVSGDTSEQDEACAIAGVIAAGLEYS